MFSHLRGALMVAAFMAFAVPSQAADDEELPLAVMHVFKPLKGHISYVTFSPDEKTIAAGATSTNTLFLWDVDTGKERLRVTLDHPCYTINTAFSADGKTIAWEDAAAGVVRIFDTTSGKLVRQFSFSKPLPKASAGHHSFGSAFSLTGKRFVVVGFYSRNSVTLWDVETGKLLREFSHETANSCAISADEKMVATQDAFGQIRVWDRKGKKLHEFQRKPQPKGVRAAMTMVAFSPDGKYLAAGGQLDDQITLWNLQTGKQARQIDLSYTRGGRSSLVFTRDSKWLGVGITVGATELLQFWDVDSGKKVGHLKGEAFGGKAVQISANRGYLTTNGVNKVSLYGPKKGHEKELPFFVPAPSSKLKPKP